MRVTSVALGIFALGLVFITVFCGFSSPALANSKPESLKHLDQLMSVDDMRHLLMRTGLGANPSDIVQFSGLSRAQAIERVIQNIKTEPDIPMPDWVLRPLPHFHARNDMNEAQRRQFNKERNAEMAQLRQWWVLNMLQTSSPQTERMVLFWHDLFATDYRDLGRMSLAMARQNQTFRELGFGSWEVLLKAMIRDPALLVFLDSGSNHKASPNENLARELMELFVLGEGHFDENTVREAARALTGHDSALFHNLAFRLKTGAQDRNEKTLFARTGKFDGDDLVELLLEQDAAPRFLATRFWHAFVSDNLPPETWIAEQALSFRQSGYNILALYRRVLQSETFWDTQHRGSIIKSPVDLVIGTARTLEYPKNHWLNMPKWLSTLGMDLFAPPNVAGWQEGAAFITPGHLLNRYRIVEQMMRVAERDGRHADSEVVSAGTMTEAAMTDIDGQLPKPDSSMMAEESIMRDSQSGDQVDVSIQMAAEDYRGPVEFQVSLVEGSSVLWRGNRTLFENGHDTIKHGRIGSSNDLNWQNVSLKLPSESVASATSLRVHFLNHAAGQDGDRNLYINGVRIQDHWMPAADGSQHSRCTPSLSNQAGNLYCSGYLELDLESLSDTDGLNLKGILPAQGLASSAVHMQWGRHNKKNEKRAITIVLDDLHTPAQDFSHVRFMLEKKRQQPLVLQIDSFSCWPDCLKQWLECAWEDKHFPARKMIFMPWINNDDERWTTSAKNYHCQFSGLNANEKLLYSTLWAHMPQILSSLKVTPNVSRRREQWEPIINFMQDQIDQSSVHLKDTPYAQFARQLTIDTRFASPPVVLQELPAPELRFSGVRTWMDALAKLDLLAHQILLPELNDTHVPAGPVADSKRAARHLKALLEHPVFQLK